MGTTGPIGKLCTGAPTFFLRHYLSCMQAAKWSTQKHQKWRYTHHSAGTCDGKVVDLYWRCLFRNLAGTAANLTEILCGFPLSLQADVGIVRRLYQDRFHLNVLWLVVLYCPIFTELLSSLSLPTVWNTAQRHEKNWEWKKLSYHRTRRTHSRYRVAHWNVSYTCRLLLNRTAVLFFFQAFCFFVKFYKMISQSNKTSSFLPTSDGCWLKFGVCSRWQ
jgi:hypothetical protein